MPRPTDRFEVLQLLENYIPTAIATLIEPFWVLATRLLCIFQPFNDLRPQKKAPQAKKAMNLDYTSLPPQLSIWRALRAGHVLISVVCLVALLANVLAVGLGGLFNEKPVPVTHPIDLVHLRSERFQLDKMGSSTNNDARQDDNMFSVKSNFTLGTQMPPWATAEYYFQPFAAISPNPHNSTEMFKGRTRGYGLDITCSEAQTTKPVNDTLPKEIIVDVRSFNEEHGITDPACPGLSQLGRGEMSNKTSSTEGAWGSCTKLGAMILYWGRMTYTPERTVDYRAYACQSKFKTALFDVTIDSDGHILSYERASDFTDNLGYDRSWNDTIRLVEMVTGHMTTNAVSWHPNSMSLSWFIDVLKASLGEKILDPNEPIPDPSVMLPATMDIWRRAFAYLLASDAVPYQPLEENQPAFGGTRFSTETRIFMETSAFIISVSILALYVVVATFMYGFSMDFFLPRMPTTIASILEFMAPSRALRDDSPISETRFAFGRYIGRDGRRHVGIEYAELVVPIDTVALKRGSKSRAHRILFGRCKRSDTLIGDDPGSKA